MRWTVRFLFAEVSLSVTMTPASANSTVSSGRAFVAIDHTYWADPDTA